MATAGLPADAVDVPYSGSPAGVAPASGPPQGVPADAVDAPYSGSPAGVTPPTPGNGQPPTTVQEVVVTGHKMNQPYQGEDLSPGAVIKGALWNLPGSLWHAGHQLVDTAYQAMGSPLYTHTDTQNPQNNSILGFQGWNAAPGTGSDPNAFKPEITLAKAAGGLAQHAVNAVAGPNAPQFASTATADAIGQQYKDEYGGWNNIKNTVKNNPAAPILDAASVVDPALKLGALAKVGMAAKAADVADVADAANTADQAAGAAQGAAQAPPTAAPVAPPTSIADIRARLQAQRSGQPVPDATPQPAPAPVAPSTTPPMVGRSSTGATHDADVMQQALKENNNQLNSQTLARMDQLQAAKDAAQANPAAGGAPAPGPAPAATPDIPANVDFNGPKPLSATSMFTPFVAGVRGGLENQAYNLAKAGKTPLDPIAAATQAAIGSDDAATIAPAIIQNTYDAVRKSNFAGATNVTGVTPKLATTVDGIMSDIGSNSELQTPARLAQISDRLGSMKTTSVADQNYLSDSKRVIDDALEGQAPTFQNMRARIQAATAAGKKSNPIMPSGANAWEDATLGAGGPELLEGVLGNFGKRGAQGFGHALGGPVGGAAAGILAGSPRLAGTFQNVLGTGLRPGVQAGQLTGVLAGAGLKSGAQYGLPAMPYASVADKVQNASDYDVPMSLTEYRAKHPVTGDQANAAAQ